MKKSERDKLIENIDSGTFSYQDIEGLLDYVDRLELSKAKLEAALEFYFPIIQKQKCAHDDSSWCDEYCGDGGKHAPRKALECYCTQDTDFDGPGDVCRPCKALESASANKKGKGGE